MIRFGAVVASALPLALAIGDVRPDSADGEQQYIDDASQTIEFFQPLDLRHPTRLRLLLLGFDLQLKCIHVAVQNPKSLVQKVEQSYAIKFFMDKSMKWVGIIDRLNHRYCRDAIQRMQVYCWIPKVKLGRKNLSNIPRVGKTPDERLGDSIGKTLKEDADLSTRRI
jgi:hypothetical protein